MVTPVIPPAPSPTPVPFENDTARLKEAAIQFEAAFLAEMLKSSGLSTTPGAVGGGAGEDQFSTFLIREHAIQMARAGGIGLAETVFQAMLEKSNE